ncbi:M48 family metallopeptidase [Chlamydiales bacterium]|nr:M48 family metallopeptidase [Chlamydiales bacterium]
MKVLRIIFFLILICGAVGVSLILFKEKPQPPFSRSLAPFFQELGKPIKSVDRALSRMLSIEEIDEKTLGDEIKLRFAETSKPRTVDEEITVRYLNSLITSLSSETRRSFEYQVFLIDGPPNAFAMPGGALCVTNGLLAILENEAELVAVLGHEMGHVERGHLFDAARGEMLQRKISNTSILTYASNIIHMIARLSFSKTEEDEADEYGFRMLLKMGYDPIAICTSFEKLVLESTKEQGSTNPFEDFFSSHPYTEHRIEKFRSRAKLWEQNYPNEKRRHGKNNFKGRVTVFEEKE